MQPIGAIIAFLGILMLMFRSITFFTTERVAGPAGFFTWDVERPYTFFISPIAGMIAIAIGMIMVMWSPRERAT